MRPRFRLAFVLTLVTTLVVGVAVFGFLASTFYDARSSVMVPLLATSLGTVLSWASGAVMLSWITGALCWSVLFLLQRDGMHRLEWVALQPGNYGGRSPFDLSQR